MASATPERDAGRLPPWPSGIALVRPRAHPSPAEPDTVDRVLRKVIGLTVFTAVLATAFIFLGRWQLSRLDERRADNAQVTSARDVAAVPIDALAEPGTPLDPALEWRRATATGRYDVDGTILVRNRAYQGANGLLVVVPLITPARGRPARQPGLDPRGGHRHRAPGRAAAAERRGGRRGAAPPRRAAPAGPGPAGRTRCCRSTPRALPRTWPSRSTAATAIWWRSGRRPTPPRCSRSRPRSTRARTWATPSSGSASRSSPRSATSSCSPAGCRSETRCPLRLRPLPRQPDRPSLTVAQTAASACCGWNWVR